MAADSGSWDQPTLSLGGVATTPQTQGHEHEAYHFFTQWTQWVQGTTLARWLSTDSLLELGIYQLPF